MNNMKIIHIHNEYPEHDWVRNDKGEIDEWQLDAGYHNGPMCLRCYHSFCVHCETYEEQDPCVVDKYKCPKCGHELGYNTNQNFCFHCGQALDWSEC